MKRTKVIPPECLGQQLPASIISTRYVRKPDMAVITVLATYGDLEIEVERKVWAKPLSDDSVQNARLRDMLGCRDVSREVFVREIETLVNPSAARYDLTVRLAISDSGNQFFYLDRCNVTQLSGDSGNMSSLAAMISRLEETVSELQTERMCMVDNFQKLDSYTRRLKADYEELHSRYLDVVGERNQLRRKLGMDRIPDNAIEFPGSGT